MSQVDEVRSPSGRVLTLEGIQVIVEIPIRGRSGAGAAESVIVAATNAIAVDVQLRVDDMGVGGQHRQIPFFVRLLDRIKALGVGDQLDGTGPAGRPVVAVWGIAP